MAQKLIIIRGLPGSGKTTKAKEMVRENPNFKHYEADMYFEKDGEYKFVPSDLSKAHNWCYQMAEQSIQLGDTVIVSNTFTTQREVDPYSKLAKKYNIPFEIILLTENYGNIHGVPQETLNKMQRRFQVNVE
jgi:predicted kinase